MIRPARVNVAGVLFDREGRVLLCKRSLSKKVAPGMWHLPGGKIEEGETPTSAIVREFKEELGLKVSRVRETDVAHTYPVGTEMHQTVFVRVETTGTVVLDHENIDHAFVAPTDIGVFIEPHLLAVNNDAIAAASASFIAPSTIGA